MKPTPRKTVLLMAVAGLGACLSERAWCNLDTTTSPSPTARIAFLASPPLSNAKSTLTPSASSAALIDAIGLSDAPSAIHAVDEETVALAKRAFGFVAVPSGSAPAAIEAPAAEASPSPVLAAVEAPPASPAERQSIALAEVVLAEPPRVLLTPDAPLPAELPKAPSLPELPSAPEAIAVRSPVWRTPLRQAFEWTEAPQTDSADAGASPADTATMPSLSAASTPASVPAIDLLATSKSDRELDHVMQSLALVLHDELPAIDEPTAPIGTTAATPSTASTTEHQVGTLETAVEAEAVGQLSDEHRAATELASLQPLAVSIPDGALQEVAAFGPVDAADAPALTSTAEAVTLEATASIQAPEAQSTPSAQAPSESVGQSGRSPFEGAVALGAGQLDRMRGGFIGDNGVQISFGIERAVYINGALVTTTSLNVGDLGKMSGGQASVTNGAGAVASNGFSVIQNGAGNTFVNGPVTPTTLGTIVQNTLNDQKIQSVTQINATVNSLQMLKSSSFQSTLRGAVIDSLRR